MKQEVYLKQKILKLRVRIFLENNVNIFSHIVIITFK